jgi:hypothetical protein
MKETRTAVGMAGCRCSASAGGCSRRPLRRAPGDRTSRASAQCQSWPMIKHWLRGPALAATKRGGRAMRRLASPGPRLKYRQSAAQSVDDNDHASLRCLPRPSDTDRPPSRRFKVVTPPLRLPCRTNATPHARSGRGLYLRAARRRQARRRVSADAASRGMALPLVQYDDLDSWDTHGQNSCLQR